MFGISLAVATFCGHTTSNSPFCHWLTAAPLSDSRKKLRCSTHRGLNIRRSVRSAAPTADVARLAARFLDGEVPALTVTRPSLEDTYLTLIAPHLDDDRTEVPA